MIDYDINGLICIDLWDICDDHDLIEKHNYDTWLDQLAERLCLHNWHSIINACYDYRIDYNDPSIYNTLICYNWHEFDDAVMMELVANAGQGETSHAMRKIFGATAFALWSHESLRKHQIKLVPHVNKWLVVGQSWQNCVHDRPLGLINLLKRFSPLGHEFYGATWGFCKRNAKICDKEDFDADRRITWQHIGNDIFKASLADRKTCEQQT